MRGKLLLAMMIFGAACGDGEAREEGRPSAVPSDSGILSDTAKRDITVPNDPGPRG